MTTRLLTNCRIYTFDPVQPLVEALAIQDNLVQAAGRQDEVLEQIKTPYEKNDLQGQIVLPGLCDAHIHLLEYGFSLQRVNCETATRAECIQRIQQRIQGIPEGKWVLGHGWNHNIWPEGSGTKEQLDAISAGHPVYLTHKSLHSAWANSKALEIAGIDEGHSDPDGGQFQRDDKGRMTGIILEKAMRVIEQAIPAPDPSEREEALLKAQQTLNSFGITAVHDFDVWECLSALQSLHAQKKLLLRVTKSIPLAMLEEAIQSDIQSGKGDAQLSFGWLKLFADGALGPQTAAMLEPYKHSTSKGMLFLQKDQLAEFGRQALEHGISLAVHAIGDRANREVIDAFAQLNQQSLLVKSQLPNRIEHVQLITPQDMQRMADLGIVASMQPIHQVSDQEMADRHWGERCRHAYAWQSVQSKGMKLVFGSDAPVESPNPFWGLYAATERKPLHAQKFMRSWQPQERLNRQTALDAYIRTPQIISGKGEQFGKLKAGCRADLTVLPLDPFSAAEQELVTLNPSTTMINGAWVFQKS